MGNESGTKMKSFIEVLERSFAFRFDAFKSELEHLHDKAENIAKVNAQQESIMQDIARLYTSIKDSETAVSESIQRIHLRMDGSSQVMVEEIGKVHESLGHATDRIENNLGEKVTDLGKNLSLLKGDYDQKISAIKAVWYILGILFVILQATGGFLIKAYVAGWQSRIESLETSIAENKKETQRATENLKELQTEVLTSKTK